MHPNLQGSLPSLPITQWRGGWQGEGECVWWGVDFLPSLFMPVRPPAVTVKGWSKTERGKKEAFSINQIIHPTWQRPLRFPKTLKKMWSLVQTAKMRVVGFWVSKLATKANVHSVGEEAIMSAARYKPDPSSDKTPGNSTCQHPSPFCRQHPPPTVVVRVCVPVCARSTRLPGRQGLC